MTATLDAVVSEKNKTRPCWRRVACRTHFDQLVGVPGMYLAELLAAPTGSGPR